MNWKEHKPAIKFISWFLGIYLIGNLAYGFYIEAQYPHPDAITKSISIQTSWLLNGVGNKTDTIVNQNSPTVSLLENGKLILRIYEGCNGVNVMIVFIAFIISFGGRLKSQLWFTGLGVIIIHCFNLLRIVLLFWVARYHQSYFYYVHKYLFTAALYVVVIGLWWVWVFRVLKIKPLNVDAKQ